MEVEWEGQTTEPIPVSNRSVAGVSYVPSRVYAVCDTFGAGPGGVRQRRQHLILNPQGRDLEDS